MDAPVRSSGASIYSAEITVLVIGIAFSAGAKKFTEKLTETELREEIAKAEKFEPALQTFTLASTVPRDAAIQESARKLSIERGGRAPQGIHVYSWDDIEEALQIRRQLIRLHYPEFFVPAEQSKTSEGYVSFIAPAPSVYAQVENFFEATAIRTAIAEELRLELVTAVVELALNSFEHGNARRVKLLFRDDALVIEDDGREFDVIKQLRSPAKQAKREPGGVGLVYLGLFLRKWGADINIYYLREGSLNRVTLRPRHPWTSEQYARACDIILKEPYTHGPILAAHAEFPLGCAEYHLNVSRGRFNASTLYEFLIALFKKIPAESKLVVSIEDDLLEKTIRSAMSYGAFDPTRMVIQQKRLE